MIKGVFGIHKLARWFKCIILDRHHYNKLPVPLGATLITIYKCCYCGRTLCDY